MWKKLLIGIAVVIVIGAASWGPIVSNVEQAKYTVVEAHGPIEIRDYAPMIVAEAVVSGERKAAFSQGFRLIADYIFGNNATAEDVAMTAPVIQQPTTKIAMTAPVTQQADGKSWKVRFIMPASYTIFSLPKPNNNAVTLETVPAKRFAVIRFSGMGREASLNTHAEKLREFMASKNLTPVSEITFAFFNPPWTLPFLRRNEVMVEISRQ